MENEQELKRTLLYEQVADMLERAIVCNHFEGERLPSEQHLAEKYNVSRTVVREALKLLRERGLIDSKTGSGAYITRPEEQNLSDVIARIIRTSKIDYGDVYDVRSILETVAARRAALHVTEKELEEMEEYLKKTRDLNLSAKERAEYDYQFHYMIAKASRNLLLVMLAGALGLVFKEVIELSSDMEGSMDDGIRRHKEILDALRLRDAELAEHMMYGHIYQSKCYCMEILEKRREHETKNTEAKKEDIW